MVFAGGIFLGLPTLYMLLYNGIMMGAVAVAVGCVESLVARLRMRFVPRYLMLSSVVAALCLGVAVMIGLVSATSRDADKNDRASPIDSM